MVAADACDDVILCVGTFLANDFSDRTSLRAACRAFRDALSPPSVRLVACTVLVESRPHEPRRRTRAVARLVRNTVGRSKCVVPECCAPRLGTVSWPNTAPSRVPPYCFHHSDPDLLRGFDLCCFS
jgi:hypothetical protein